MGDDLLEERAQQGKENPLDSSSPVIDLETAPNSRMSTRSVELTSSVGIRRFLKECARCKGCEPKFVATRKNLESVADALTKSNVLGATVANLQKLNRRLNENYKRNPETNAWASELGYLRGEAGANNPFLGESDSDGGEIQSDDGEHEMECSQHGKCS